MGKAYYYVSYYEAYPIYEPAEGGYYYEGLELVESYRVGSLKRARRLLKKLACDYDLGEIRPNMAVDQGRYIGDRRVLRIETVMGIKESGKVIYQ